jgi:hypothetical protein
MLTNLQINSDMLISSLDTEISQQVVVLCFDFDPEQCVFVYLSTFVLVLFGARSSVVGSGTMLQAGRSRVRFPMRLLNFSIELILTAALCPWSRLSL